MAYHLRSTFPFVFIQFYVIIFVSSWRLALERGAACMPEGVTSVTERKHNGHGIFKLILHIFDNRKWIFSSTDENHFFFFELNDDVDFILHTTSNESMKLTSIAPTLSQTKKKTKWNQLPQSNEFRKYIENKYRFMSTIELPFRSNKRTEYLEVLDSNNRINYIQNLPFEGATATQTNQI